MAFLTFTTSVSNAALLDTLSGLPPKSILPDFFLEPLPVLHQHLLAQQHNVSLFQRGHLVGNDTIAHLAQCLQDDLPLP